MAASSQPPAPPLAPPPRDTADINQAIAAEERAGLKLAALGRVVALALVAAFCITELSPPLVFFPLLMIVLFTALAVSQFVLVDLDRFPSWLLHTQIAAEAVLLVITLVAPNPFNDDPWPRQMAFRSGYFVVAFVVIATAAFSYRAPVMLWSGLCVAAAWAVAVLMVYARPETLGWPDAPPGLSSEDSKLFYLQPTFMPLGSRLFEVLCVLMVAALLALVVYRARKAVAKLVTLQRERAFIHETFGHYVPESVAGAILSDQGALRPELRNATILIADVAGFTSLCERMPPERFLALLDDYFDAAGGVITRTGGVIYQFQGDGIIAAFNLPVPIEHHHQAAVEAGLGLQALVATRLFQGERLSIRVGIASGDVVAGSVGGGHRRAYTVHGDAANLAARLEQLNKDLGTGILLCGPTRDGAMRTSNSLAFAPVGKVPIRGRSGEIPVFTVTSLA